MKLVKNGDMFSFLKYSKMGRASKYIRMEKSADSIYCCSEDNSLNLPAQNEDNQKSFFSRFCCLNFRSLKCFMFLAYILILAQECAQVYFNRTAQFWQKELGFSEKLTDWLTEISSIVQLIFTVFIIHATVKSRRTIWISLSTIILVVTSFTLLIPEFIHPVQFTGGKSLKEYMEIRQLYPSASQYSVNLNSQEVSPISSRGMYWLNFSLIVIFQIALGLSTVLLFIHGSIFIDDHGDMNNGVILNGFFLAFKQTGLKVGDCLVWFVMIDHRYDIFKTIEWISLCIILLILGLLIGLFPSFLSLKFKNKNDVCCIDSPRNKKDLFSILNRIVTNKVVFLNILCSAFFWSAVTNFSFIGNDLEKSKFSYPDGNLFQNSNYFEIIFAWITPIAIFAAVGLTVLLITKYDLKAFHLAVCNALTPTILIIVFVIYVYLDCERPRFERTHKYCNLGSCADSLYEPICVTNLQATYLSPCHAGCSSVNTKHGFMVFDNCICTSSFNVSFSASPGLCSMTSCYFHWIIQNVIQQVINMISNIALICQIGITMYCVHHSERAYALAIHISVLSLREFGPIRSAFNMFASEACRYVSPSYSCLLHDPVILTRFIITLVIAFLILSSLTGLFTALVIRYKTGIIPDIFVGFPQNPWRREASSQTSDGGNRGTTVEMVPMTTFRTETSGSQEAIITTAQIHPILNRPTVDTILENTSDDEDMSRRRRIALNLEQAGSGQGTSGIQETQV